MTYDPLVMAWSPCKGAGIYAVVSVERQWYV